MIIFANAMPSDHSAEIPKVKFRVNHANGNYLFLIQETIKIIPRYKMIHVINLWPKSLKASLQ